MNKWIVNSLALVMLCGAPVFAQDGDGPPPRFSPEQMIARRVSRLTTVLTLSSAQQTQAAAIFSDEEASSKTIRNSMRAAHRALQTAIQNNDAAGITTQATQIGALTTQEIESRSKAEAAFYALLSADQQAKFKQLHEGGPMGGGVGGHFRP